MANKIKTKYRDDNGNILWVGDKVWVEDALYDVVMENEKIILEWTDGPGNRCNIEKVIYIASVIKEKSKGGTMANQIKGFYVAIENTNEEHAQLIRNAIKMINGVIDVEEIEKDVVNDCIVELKVRQEIREEVHKLFRKI